MRSRLLLLSAALLLVTAANNARGAAPGTATCSDSCRSDLDCRGFCFKCSDGPPTGGLERICYNPVD